MEQQTEQTSLARLPEEVSMMIATPHLINNDFKTTLQQHLTLALVDKYCSRIFLSPTSICAMVNNYCNLYGSRELLKTIRSHFDANPQKLNLMNFLITKGIDLDKLKDSEGTGLFLYAASKKYNNVVILLAQAKADINQSSIIEKIQINALFCAASDNNTELIRYLLDHNIDTSYYTGAIKKALVKNAAESACLILNHPQAIFCQDILNTFLPYTQAQDNVALLKALKSKGADLFSIIDEHNNSLLCLAACHGHEKCVEFLLNEGLPIDHQGLENYSPLLLVARNNQSNVFDLLLERGANPEIRSSSGDTAIILTSCFGTEQMVQNLLRHHADPHTANLNGINALIGAAMRGNTENVKLLLAQGVNPNHITPQGQCALNQAANAGYAKVIKRLIKGGADWNAQGNFNQTPLIVASWKKHERVVKILLKQRPHLEIKEGHGLTALGIASAEGNTEIVKCLLAAGANKNTQDNAGETPLWSAAKNNHVAIVSLLLEHGADRTMPDNNGITPLSIASQRGNTEIEKMLNN
jgi:ankyrin repeat protein